MAQNTATDDSWTDEYPSESATTIKHHLSQQGASQSLAGAVADAAAAVGLNRRMISYDDIGSGKTIYVHSGSNPVPDALHERLTGMGFGVMDKYDAHGDDGPAGCKYEDTKY